MRSLNVEGDHVNKDVSMPEIARFYGIVIKLYFGDHPPPHFHAVYGECMGLMSIDNLQMVEGDLPPRALRLVVEWASLNQAELLRMWERQEFYRLPGLD
jgi:hypothetical protein